MVHSPNQRGFTLLELVVVIATVSVLVAALVPQDNLSNMNVEAATQRFEQDIRYARELAVTKNVNCGLQILTNGNYTVYQGTPATPALDPLTQQSFSYNLGNNFKNVNIRNINATLLIEFDPLGKPVSGAATTVQVGDTSKTISLLVTSNTGFIQRL